MNIKTDNDFFDFMQEEVINLLKKNKSGLTIEQILIAIKKKGYNLLAVDDIWQIRYGISLIKELEIQIGEDLKNELDKLSENPYTNLSFEESVERLKSIKEQYVKELFLWNKAMGLPIKRE
ncbi:hypothetical protein NEF87_000227 [Candidatus Lokiarchaeum ossiferum]|uniref:Uncharacterized protein n=1 Tax=Candidatus Lokiarchaeum ossiferum TaxID=2951803 RepID=A0ABY6HNG5_9ARCH|nr:hypothetical protein NEF87_000227 [Candidatus Lokiarchaeum sp. B-35]